MIQFVATVVVLMTILDSVQATPSVRRLSRYSRYWDQATAVDDWIDSLSDYKLSYFQDMIQKGYADALIDTFAAQHDEYGDYYDNDYYESPAAGSPDGAAPKKHHYKTPAAGSPDAAAPKKAHHYTPAAGSPDGAAPKPHLYETPAAGSPDGAAPKPKMK